MSPASNGANFNRWHRYRNMQRFTVVVKLETC
jgi:hypothetical protein